MAQSKEQNASPETTTAHAERGDLDKMTKKPSSVQRELAEARRIVSEVIVPTADPRTAHEDPTLDKDGNLRSDVISHVRQHAREAKAAGWGLERNSWKGTRLEHYWHDAWCEA